MRSNYLLLLLHLFRCTGAATTALVQNSSKSTRSVSTCPSRTVNYITHGLPQQCLPYSRTSSNETGPATATPSSRSEADNTTTSNTTQLVTQLEPTTLTQQSGHPVVQSEDEKQKESTPAKASQSVTESSVASTTLASQEEESLLEDSQFLSFEEWKRQNLKKADRSKHTGKNTHTEQQPRKRPTHIHSDLDSLGDDAEIDLDFSGFFPGKDEIANTAEAARTDDLEHDSSKDAGVTASSARKGRQKDAGTTSKERFNYASFDCAANVLKYNPEAKSASAVLGENKDSYMLNVCSVKDKFIILELCNDILIDTVVLANFEFFSSTFRTFRVSLSDKYPVKSEKWKTLGTFEARNTRDVQAFLVQDPVMWARYVRIEFLTHYGSEYYCPVSLIRMHGITMVEEIKQDRDGNQPDDDDDTDANEVDMSPSGYSGSTDARIIVESAPKSEQDSDLSAKPAETVSELVKETLEASQQLPFGATSGSSSAGNHLTASLTQSHIFVTSNTLLSDIVKSSTTILPETCGVRDTPFGSEQLSSTLVDPSIIPLGESFSEPPLTTVTIPHTDTSTSHSVSSTKSSDSFASQAGDGHPSAPSKLKSNASVTNSINPKSGSSTNTEKSKTTATSIQPQSAVPTVQESFFKSVQKRLQMLEANSSLSLQYIEEQSRALRTAFNKVEQRQLIKTTTFLEFLNTTVLNELRDFRQQYDQLWQSTVIELEMQRERYQQETLAINARLAVLADEVIFQKRMSILQMILILVSLVLVLFAKAGVNTYLEMPLVQSVLSRSPSSRWISFNHLETPRRKQVTRTRSAHELRAGAGTLEEHGRQPSDVSIDGDMSPGDVYSPPTPVRFRDISDNELSEREDEDIFEDPEFDPSTIERPQTSPPVLPSIDQPSAPNANCFPSLDSIDSRLSDAISPIHGDSILPEVVIDPATPTSKHLTWSLPDG